jgi:hypothetical protein
MKNPCNTVAGVVTQVMEQGKWEAARSQRSKVRITAQTNFSLEHCLFQLMTDEKYLIIHMFHVG